MSCLAKIVILFRIKPSMLNDFELAVVNSRFVNWSISPCLVWLIVFGLLKGLSPQQNCHFVLGAQHAHFEGFIHGLTSEKRFSY